MCLPKDLSILRTMSSTLIILNEISKILAPVTACCIYVAFLFEITASRRFVDPQFNANSYYCRVPSGHLTNPNLCRQADQEKTDLGSYIIMVMVLLVMMLGITMAVLLAVYMKWFKCLECYFYLPSLVTFTMLCPVVYRRVLESLNPNDSLDLITFSIIMWNFTALGMISIFQKCLKAPFLVEQFFLVHNAAILAVIVVWMLPGFSDYILLVAIVIWDLFAVLAPCGPLKMIINMAQDEGIQDMPGLIYATGREQMQSDHLIDKHKQTAMKQSETAKNVTKHADQGESQTIRSPIIETSQILTKKTVDSMDEFENNINMGLGDFVVYGILVASSLKSSSAKRDYYALIGVILSILFGIILTFSLLATTKKAVPALPISITIGLLILPISSKFVPQLADSFAAEQYFV